MQTLLDNDSYNCRHCGDLVAEGTICGCRESLREHDWEYWQYGGRLILLVFAIFGVMVGILYLYRYLSSVLSN